MSGSDIEQRMAKLERRLRDVEDRLEIMQILARYGPAVDSCSREATAALWADDGRYDFGGEPLAGADAVGALVDLPSHRAYVGQGCVHALGAPVIAVDGDRAVATCNSRVYLHDGDGWRVERAAANRWILVRTEAGWKVLERTNCLANGNESARQLFAGAWKSDSKETASSK